MTGERVDVLRLGYRLGRDPRITTHLALVGRALGADRFLLAGDEDSKMFENLESDDDIKYIEFGKLNKGVNTKKKRKPRKLQFG